MAATYQKTSLDWQLQKLGQRVSEWIELRLPDRSWFDGNSPAPWVFPDWWFEVALWGMVALLVLCVGIVLYRWLWPYLQGKQRHLKTWRDRSQRATPPVQSPLGWLQQAQHQQRQGQYREACRSLYMALLQRLHEGDLVPHDASRTDGEYQRILAQTPAALACQILIQTHERLQFGQAEISQEGYERCLEAYQSLDRGLRS
ncbi:DUF4129 domain-containing protein [Lyngbya confervoides]|uniref:DUF4129 domain-containing protein n=1 Tax=Lyngbya confervoides BDU141951 TaxID=1574623 RepID=A0ABD4T736_9CYAN|nr:DUF4129 domain-containing protein [Lyngbya confervoides]MCM1984557.1 DUF4129 domain-containing protein [Lyngbya confervoides BDU141951]